MTKFKYIEMTELDYNEITEIPNNIRVNVETDEEALSIYNANKDDFNNVSAKIVDGEHFEDASLNTPCVARVINTNGSIEE